MPNIGMEIVGITIGIVYRYRIPWRDYIHNGGNAIRYHEKYTATRTCTKGRTVILFIIRVTMMTMTVIMVMVH